MKGRLPIDAKRDAAFSMTIEGAGALTDMIPIGDTLFIVSERCVHAVKLADQIDPQRSNPNIPHTQQKVLPVGSTDLVVGQVLLTANTLFEPKFLGAEFNREEALKLALDLLKDLVAMIEISTRLLAAEQTSREAFEARGARGDALQLPSVDNVEARFDSYIQKAGHVVDTLEQIAELFYPTQITKKWVDSLLELVTARYGSDSPFAKFMRGARLALLYVREIRNMIEHPLADCRVEVRDFSIT